MTHDPVGGAVFDVCDGPVWSVVESFRELASPSVLAATSVGSGGFVGSVSKVPCAAGSSRAQREGVRLFV